MPSSYRVLMMVALGSAVGGVLRYLVGNVLGDAVHVPWRTFVVNVTGSFVLGAFLCRTPRLRGDRALRRLHHLLDVLVRDGGVARDRGLRAGCCLCAR